MSYDDDLGILRSERNKLMTDFYAALDKHKVDAELRADLHDEIHRLRKRQTDDMALCKSLKGYANSAINELHRETEKRQEAYQETLQLSLRLNDAWEFIKHVMTCEACDAGNECNTKWRLYDEAARKVPLRRKRERGAR